MISSITQRGCKIVRHVRLLKFEFAAGELANTNVCEGLVTLVSTSEFCANISSSSVDSLNVLLVRSPFWSLHRKHTQARQMFFKRGRYLWKLTAELYFFFSVMTQFFWTTFLLGITVKDFNFRYEIHMSKTSLGSLHITMRYQISTCSGLLNM